MGLPGTLTKDKFGFSMPLDAPLFYPLPIFYKDVSMLLFQYVTDPAAAAALLPKPLELADPPIVIMLFANYPWSTLGPYRETAQAIRCVYKGKSMNYAARLHVTNDAAMAAGREIAGFPKKLGEIEFINDETYFSYLERPKGLRICSGVLKPIKVIPGAIPMTFDFATVRLIPSPEPGAPPSLVQLVQTQWVLSSGEMWGGVGTCQFTGASDSDPYHRLPIVKPVATSLFRGEMQIAGAAHVLENL